MPDKRIELLIACIKNREGVAVSDAHNPSPNGLRTSQHRPKRQDQSDP